MVLVYSKLDARHEIEENWENEDQRKNLEQKYSRDLVQDHGLHILLIGISKYRQDSYMSKSSTLTNSAKSVFNLYTFFHKKKDSLNISTIRVLISPSNDEKKDNLLNTFYNTYKNNIEANETNFPKELKKFYKQKTSENAVTIFYFAGHGLLETLTSNQILLCSDFHETTIASTCIKLSEIIPNAIEQSQQKNHLICIDCCRNGVSVNSPNWPVYQRVQTQVISSQINPIFTGPTINHNVNSILLFSTLKTYSRISYGLDCTPFSLAIKNAFLGYSLKWVGKENWIIDSESFVRAVKIHNNREVEILNKKRNINIPNKIVPGHIGSVQNFNICKWTDEMPFFQFHIVIEPRANIKSSVIIKIFDRNFSNKKEAVFLHLLNKNFYIKLYPSTRLDITSTLDNKKKLNYLKTKFFRTSPFDPYEKLSPLIKIPLSHDRQLPNSPDEYISENDFSIDIDTINERIL